MKRMVWKRWAPPLVLLALFLLLVVRLNQVDKVALVSREGQTFEKGVVTEILQDNVQPDGSRVGEQVVRVLMKTGELKGREIETTSSSGFLFGAPCTVGMKVVVMQSLAGDTVVSQRLRPGPGVPDLGLRGAVSAGAVSHRRLAGGQGRPGTGVYLRLHFVGVSAPGVPGLVPLLSAVLVCAVTAVVTLWLVGGPTRKTLGGHRRAPWPAW